MAVYLQLRFKEHTIVVCADYVNVGILQTPNWKMAVIRVFLLIVACTRTYTLQESIATDSTGNNCWAANFVIPPSSKEIWGSELDVAADALVDDMKNNSNVSHLKTSTLVKSWQEKPRLKFPKFTTKERYKMASLHLNKGWFAFNFLRGFFSFIQPYNIPTDLLVDVVENHISITKLMKESIHVEVIFLSTAGLCCILACVIPIMEFRLICRSNRKNYKLNRHTSVFTFFLAILTFILGFCMITMTLCNEAISTGIGKLPITVEIALHDINEYHIDAKSLLRKYLIRNLDIAREAILTDLDNVKELLGEPVQAELSNETGLHVALEALFDLANETQGLSTKVESLLRESERAHELGLELSRETDEIRRNVESAVRACSGPDRYLCAVIDSSGIRLRLQIERLLKDDRLLRIQRINRKNLTEAAREAHMEYLHIPHHIARTTLDARNQIRRKINGECARICNKTSSMEANSFEVSKQLNSLKNITDYVVRHVVAFEHIRWIVGIATVLCILLVFLLLFGALCCRCGSCQNRVRATLLCSAVISCFVLIVLWAVFIVAMGLSSHAEMLICRSFYDPNYSTMEALLETRAVLGRKLTIPLKELFEKCQNDETAYPAFGLENLMNLEDLTAHWTWPSLPKALTNIKVDLKGLKILTPNLQQQLQNLLYACDLNLTAHRIMIQGPILNKDLNTMSDQLDKISRQIRDRNIVRRLQNIGATMRDLILRRVKPLMKLQDNLLYHLTLLDLQMQPFSDQVNQSISHLRTVQYYIDHQGEKVVQLRTKSYVDRLVNYLDQWRTHILTETDAELSKCRPLWEILEGLRSLLCNHILSPFNGFWFTTLVCIIVMIISIPLAHVLSLVYKKPFHFTDDTILLQARTNSINTEIVDARTWQTQDPPPLPPSDW